MKKYAISMLALMLTTIGSTQIRMTMVDPANHLISVKNFGANAVNIAAYRLCALFDYQTLNQSGVTIVNGDFNLSQNEVVTVSWMNNGGFGPDASDLGLYLPSGSFGSSSNMVDFIQYGSGGQGRENVAVAGLRWTAGEFLNTSSAPWVYTGDGTQNGMMFWSAVVIGCTDSLACNYDASANQDNGTCTYPGCLDSTASNYLANAGCQAECIYPQVALTFQVNMNNEIISPNGVHLAGDIQGWNPGTTEMNDFDGDGIYEITLLGNAGALYQFKFINGNDWPFEEAVPMECGIDNGFGGYNRYVQLGSVDVVLEPVCFGECTNCIINTPVNITFQVNLADQTISPNGVHLAGDIQGWNPSTTEMTDDNSDGIYEVTLEATAGQTYQFKFINGNDWPQSESVPSECGINDGFGGYNRFVTALTEDMIYGPVCFGSCETPACDVPFACNYNPNAVCINNNLCSGFPGSPCDDGNPFTNGETYDDNCNCLTQVSNTIYDIVAASAVHNTLQVALEASGLNEVLAAPGDYTLFAPTDDAFAALPAGTVDALLADPNGALTEILLYHTIGASALSSILEDGMVVITLQGQEVIVTIDSSGIFINDAQVIIADIIADNGVVHVIDAVLIPELPVSNTIYDIVAASELHNTLQAALEASGLNEVLAAPGDYTLFAPTDDAFDALPAGTLDALLADPSGALTDILLYHVLGFSALSGSLSDGLMVTTIQGQDVTITIDSSGVFINDAQVIIADIIADNGVVHVIDAVLIPQAPVNNTIFDIISNSPDHNTLETVLLAAELESVLLAPGNYTAFAPTDAAFDALPNGLLEALLNDPNGALTAVLVYHAIDSIIPFSGLTDGANLTTMVGEDIVITVNAIGTFVNDALITIADITASNGIVHVIDAVLLPTSNETVSIFDIVDASSNHTILQSALETAGLDGVLSEPGSYTLFAPTNAAFEALPTGTLEALLADTTGALTDILLYHVLGLTALSSELADGLIVTTAQGYDVTVTINEDGIFINDAQVILADLIANNGVVHVIDAVLIPELPVSNTIYDIVANSEVHNTLQAALEASGLNEVLAAPGDYTLFAPTDDAFAALPAGTVEALLADPSGALTDILLYHVLGFSALSSSLSDGLMVTTLQGQDVVVTINANGVFINDAQVIIADIIADNGVVHVIDAVLIPEVPIGCTDPTACNYDANAVQDDGTCIASGCTDSSACNYDNSAGCDDNSCVFPGCTDFNACNYSFEAGCDDGSCSFGSNETIVIEATADSIANGISIQGDTLFSEGEYFYSYLNAGGCDSTITVVIINISLEGCLNETACNYNPSAGISVEALCVFPGCGDTDACNYDATALCFGGPCISPGCLNPVACNYDSTALCNNESLCQLPDDLLDCNGNCYNDTDGDGICDPSEIQGCTDINACNYLPGATDSSFCSYPDYTFLDCNGNCVNDTNLNGICDDIEVYGCTDPSACNFDSTATTDNESCLQSGCNDILACNYLSTAACNDGSCIYPGCTEPDACNYDANAICDSGEDCVFPGCTEFSACNYDPTAGCENGSCISPDCNDPLACNFNPAAICGDNSCIYISPVSILDCQGNCQNDVNLNGICDEFEGTYCADSSACNFNTTGSDSICYYPGCTNPIACNYDPAASCSDESCTYPGCTEMLACNYDPTASCEDGTCEFPACTDPTACNFDFYALCDDGSCVFPSCTDPTACNFDPTAICDGGVCIMSGCTDPIACNFDSSAMCDNNAGCIYSTVVYDCDGNCNTDIDSDGVCDQLEIVGCTDITACNYDVTATESGNCNYPSEFVDCDGVCLNDINSNALCDELEITGCTDAFACNYNDAATFSDNSCVYPAEYLDCSGNCLLDADGDGICDQFDSTGCMVLNACNYNTFAIYDDSTCVFPGCVDTTACNFNPEAGCDDGSCAYPGFVYNCEGLCFNDTDGDGVCNEFEIIGCTDTLACNYNIAATDAGNCEYAAAFRDCAGNCIVDTDSDGVCDEEEVIGCYDEFACNYDALATDTGECAYAAVYYDCDGNCLQDADGDSICDQVEEAGCTDTLACNFNPFVTVNDNSCNYPGCLVIDACNYNEMAGCNVDSLCTFPEMYYDCDNVCLSDADDDGVCDAYDSTGCITVGACNYNPLALFSDNTCVFPGCMILGACNYDPSAPCSVDSLCVIPAEGYDCSGLCVSDVDNDGVCDLFETSGCTNPDACNYNAFVTDDDGSCSFNSEVTVNTTIDQADYPNGYVWQGEVFTSSGSYLYIIPNDAGCDSLITLNLTITVGINETIDSEWNLWPNPARDYLNVTGNSTIEYISIADVTGKVIFTQKYHGTIDVSDFSSGMYFMQIKSSNGIEIKRFEISR